MSKRRATSRREHRVRTSSRAPSAPKPPAPRPTPPWVEAATRHGVWIVLVVAILTHAIQWLLVRANDPFYAQTMRGFDMHTYWTWAQKILGGDLLSKEFTNGGPFYYGPLYPYYLAVVFKLLGVRYGIVHGLQALWGIFPPLIMYLTTRRLFGKGAALATGLLTAVCAPILFYEQLLLMEGLLVLIHAGVLWTLVKGQSGGKIAWVWAAAAGALSAIACWGRGNFLLAIPLLAAAWVAVPLLLEWQPRSKPAPDPNVSPGDNPDHSSDESEQPKRPPEKPKQPEAPRPLDPARLRRWRWTAGAICAAAYLAGSGFFLAIPLWRNIHVAHEPVIITSNGPILLYIGNCHDAAGIFTYPNSYKKLVEQFQSQKAVPWKKELLRDMAAHPVDFISLLLKKTWMFWNSYDVADNVSYYLNERFSWLMRLSPVYWGTLVPLALIGLWTRRREWRKQLFLYVYATGFALSIILVFVVGRYRLEETLPMLVWSGAAVAAVAERIRERNWNAVAIRAVIVGAGAAILWPTLSPAARFNTPASLPPQWKDGVHLVRPNDYATVAGAYLNLNLTDEARSVLEEGVQAYPWYNGVVSRLAALYVQENNPAQAIPLLQNYVRDFGGNATLLLQLADAELRMGRVDDARTNLQAILHVDPKNAQARALLQQLPPKKP